MSVRPDLAAILALYLETLLYGESCLHLLLR
jgi:hypothetical protein